MDKVIMVGYSGHAYVVADTLQLQGYIIAGYADRTEKEQNPYRLPYLGDDSFFENSFDLEHTGFIVAIGDNRIRRKLYSKIVLRGLPLVNAIHPGSIIAKTAVVGNGVMIMGGAVVNALANIGNGVILNTASVVEHECLIGDFVHIAPGAVLAGNVSVGENTFIGANAVIRQGVIIGRDVIVGAGAVVLNDIAHGSTVVGNPGRIKNM